MQYPNCLKFQLSTYFRVQKSLCANYFVKEVILWTSISIAFIEGLIMQASIYICLRQISFSILTGPVLTTVYSKYLRFCPYTGEYGSVKTHILDFLIPIPTRNLKI